MPANSAPELRRDRRVNAAAPIVAYGDRSVLRVPGHVEALGAKRVLLVCGRTSFEASGASAMLPDLESVAKVHRWSDFAPNTDAADLRNGLGIMRGLEPDVVIGVGGGSAMDMAKLLCTFRDVQDGDVLAAIRSGAMLDRRRGRLFLVPTTSGSGAEATHFAVVYIGDGKYSIAGDGMRPDAVALDPTLSVSGSVYQRATSGIDAVCQAIESLWAAGATDRSRHFARVGLRLLLPAIEGFVNHPEAESARAMCIGSHYAGRAIDISRTTAAHALSYTITKRYGVSHGHAVALTMSAFLARHAAAGVGELSQNVSAGEHQRAMATILDAFGAETGQTASDRFSALLDEIGLERRLSGVGIRTDEERRAIAGAVNVERLGNNPIRFTYNQLSDLLAEID